MECWPVETESTVPNVDLPDRILVNITEGSTKEHSPTMVDIKRFSSYRKLINVTCIILQIAKERSFR